MVDLDSDPTKLLEVIAIGKQLLITRGSITTFSIANDVAKYFAIVPALFLAVYPELDTLNVMGLGTPQSAILSAVIFNALIIVALIPLALRGVGFRPAPGERAPAAQPVDLRRRRDRRPVHRASRRSTSSSVRSTWREVRPMPRFVSTQLYPGVRHPARADRPRRCRVPGGRDGRRPGGFPGAGQRLVRDHVGRPARSARC